MYQQPPQGYPPNYPPQGYGPPPQPPPAKSGCLTKLVVICVVGFGGLYLLSPTFRESYTSERTRLNSVAVAARAGGAAPTVSAEAPVTVTGTTTGESETFALHGGDYRVDYDWSGRGYFSAAIDNSSSLFYARLFAAEAPGPGTAHVHNVRDASYFLRITGGRCRSWSVTFTPE